MIEDTLSGAKSTRYKHAARHLLECRSLATPIADHAPFETHEAFVSRLRQNMVESQASGHSTQHSPMPGHERGPASRAAWLRGHGAITGC
jgi:hypothetical protein